MADSEKVGRLILTVHGLDYFFGPEAVKPHHEEVAYNEQTKDLVLMLEDEFGVAHVYNTIKDLRDYITDLKNSGIFINAAAFVNNRKIYRFYYDINNGVVRIDPELRFDELYRYYAIRNVYLGPNGEYIYITGITGDPDEVPVVTSNLVDMNIVNSESGDGTSVSIPQVGGLVQGSELTNGSTYIVEFYDATFKLVNIIPFQAVAVPIHEIDMAPDTGVVDLYILTNHPMGDGQYNDTACYVYRGQSANSLEVRVLLKYADGRTRDVTHENIVNGRLTIQGLEEINSDAVTPPDADEAALQTFTVVYSLVRSNASLPDSPEETEGGATIYPDSLTITRKMKVYILEDIHNNLEKMVYAPYKESVQGSTKIRMRYFGHYATGLIHDVTNIVQYVGQNSLLENGYGENQYISISVPSGSTMRAFNYGLYCAAEGENRVKINGENYRYINVNIDHFTNLYIDNESDSPSLLNIDDLLVEMHFNDIIPDYIRIRDVYDPQYYYTDYVPAHNLNGQVFNATFGHELSANKPLLIEFMKLTFESPFGTPVISNVFKTNAAVYYVRYN
jgi:hypothetical protein